MSALHGVRTISASALAWVLVVGTVACGGSHAKGATATASSASAAAVASSGPATSLTPSIASNNWVAPVPVSKSAVATQRRQPSWASCARSTKGDDVGRNVAVMAKGCEAATGMKLVGSTLSGKQAAQDAPQPFPIDARANHCYRVYACGAAGIEDLDVAVRDSAGIVIAQDSTTEGSAAVPADGAVCFSQDDKASAVVSVGLGGGNYALEVWSN